MKHSYGHIDKRIKKLFDIVRPVLESIGESHGPLHAERVMQFCEELAAEEGANLKILLPAALIHDIGLAFEGSSGTNHSVLGSENCGEYLRLASYNRDEIIRIKHCIAAHNVRHESVEPRTKEARILVDADTRDKVGEDSIPRALKHMKETGKTPKEYADHWIEVRERLCFEGLLFYTETAREWWMPLYKKTLAHWKKVAGD